MSIYRYLQLSLYTTTSQIYIRIDKIHKIGDVRVYCISIWIPTVDPPRNQSNHTTIPYRWTSRITLKQHSESIDSQNGIKKNKPHPACIHSSFFKTSAKHSIGYRSLSITFLASSAIHNWYVNLP